MTSAAPESWTPLELVRWTADYFARHEVPSPRLDAELLLAHTLGVERLDLYLRFEQPVPEQARTRYRELVRRRAAERVPVAYLTGRRDFWSLSLEVTSDTLIPRPETEILVREVVDLAPRRLADVGTGCGAVAAAVASDLPQVEIAASDVSPQALEIARQNLERLGLAERVKLCLAEGLEGLPGPFDLIASNPPYVPSAEWDSLPPEVRHEPRAALDGGADGLAVIGMLVALAPASLRPGGHLVLEVGAGQAPAVARMAGEAGAAELWIRKDLAGIERVVAARFGGGDG